MKRNYATPPSTILPQELVTRTSFHEAGHAAAIYLYNRQRQLPPVYFSIKIKYPEISSANETSARIDGGRLIQSLPLFPGYFHDSTGSDRKKLKASYLAAFEADIVNLLCGPIAEAKHVALADGEDFNAKLLTLSALAHYGGTSDLKIITDYMNSYFECQPERNTKLSELFQQAFDFVNQASTWCAITALAHFIRDNSKQSIECEEAIAVINHCLAINTRSFS
ncbi:MAG: hypothetical protein ACU837_10760 [Gammaproteobacteria bacterium]